MTTTQVVRGPYFDELRVSDTFDTTPAVTLTSGMQSSHDAIVGNRLRVSRDHSLAAAVAGRSPLASPALVWDVSIAQSTAVTEQVRANIFYRGLTFRRLPALGDTLYTTTTVAGLRLNSARPDRALTGLAALHIVTVDQQDRPVLDYWRCAMLPVSAHSPLQARNGDPVAGPGKGPVVGPHDDLGAIGREPDLATAGLCVSDWDLDEFGTASPGLRFQDLRIGQSWRVEGADVVSSAPELARLTGNIARVHHDAAAGGGQRLVYGGHTIGLAFHQLCRAIPTLVTVASWRSCGHLAPVHEGDALRSQITVLGLSPLPGGGGLALLRVEVDASAAHAPCAEDPTSTSVLDWHLEVVLA